MIEPMDIASTAAPIVGAGLGVAGGALLAYGMFAPGSRLFAPVISRGSTSGTPAVALTFDDGPWPGATDVILDHLRDVGAVATFFVIGRHARLCPGLIRRMHDEGHTIGNHSFDHHRTGMFRRQRYWVDQIRRTDNVIESTIDRRPRLFRPPMGYKSPHLAGAIRRTGHAIVAWSRRSYDGVTSDPRRIARNVIEHASSGDIILLHDGRDPASRRDVGATARAIPEIIRGIHERGFVISPLETMVTLPSYCEDVFASPGPSTPDAAPVAR